MSSIDIPVTIVNDSILEGNQLFFGNLGSPVGPITLDPDMATVIISDDAPDREFLCKDISYG